MHIRTKKKKKNKKYVQLVQTQWITCYLLEN